MSESTTAAPPRFRTSQLPQSASQAGVDVMEIAKRQFWLAATCAAIGLGLSVLYWMQAAEWYESRAKMLVTLKDPTLAEGENSYGKEGIREDVLANHMEIVRSRRIVEQALVRNELQYLPSIQQQVLKSRKDIDAVDYVLSKLGLTKGGEGSSRNARSLNFSFRHPDALDSMKVLTAIVEEYEAFLDDQLRRVMSEADELVRDAQNQVESELKEVERRYILARQQAPVLYQGEGTSNVYLEKFKRLNDEILTIDIDHASVETRLAKAREAMLELDAVSGASDEELFETEFQKLALIDSDSLSRLATFAGIQVAATQSMSFQETIPQRQQEALTEFQMVLKLRAEAQELEAKLGGKHPDVINIRNRIKLIEEFVKEKSVTTKGAMAFSSLTPKVIMEAYLGFLRHDLAALEERKIELTTLSNEAEVQAKELVEFELTDHMLRGEIARKQALFDGIVEQLRRLDTASGLSGYVHEKLESPRMGERVWPDIRICALAGCMLGLVAGIVLGAFNDQMDQRFRSPSELDTLIDVPVIGHVGRIRLSRDRKTGRGIVDAQAPEAEAFRLLRTYLLADVKGGKLKVLSATSCQTKDGKSTILSNIAASFAELGMNVLVVDGDMRAPTAHEFFSVPVQKGLSDILLKQLSIDEALKPTGVDGLSVITAGGAVRNPAELLQSKSFDELLVDLKERFDLIVVDSGPILWVSDPAIVSQKCDATLLVVRTSHDTKKKVQEAVKRLRSAKANLRGCIVNTFGSNKEFTQNSGYSSYYYYYGGGYGRKVRTNGAEAKRSESVRKRSNV